MNINLIAKLKNCDEFLKNNQEGDQQKYTMVNHYSFIQFPTMTLIADIKSLTFFLKKIETNELNNFEENLFHILFSRNFHNISQTTELCKIN